jgi:hypothetical protein
MIRSCSPHTAPTGTGTRASTGRRSVQAAVASASRIRVAPREANTRERASSGNARRQIIPVVASP